LCGNKRKEELISWDLHLDSAVLLSEIKGDILSTLLVRSMVFGVSKGRLLSFRWLPDEDGD
jgi:hypothetical protein